MAASVDVLLNGLNFRSDQGTFGFCSITLITAGDKRILVDPGHVGRRVHLLEALQKRGLTPQDIDVTVMTHAHWDHNQNFDLFYHAPVLVHRLEMKYAHHPHHNDWATPQWTGAMIDHIPNIVEVDEGYQIDPGIGIIHAPGHSPGSMGVTVETDQGLAVVAGDIIHFGGVALSKVSPIIFWSEDQARKSIERVTELAEIIYPGHDRPFRLAGGGVEYMTGQDIILSGLTPDMEGVVFDNPPRPQYVMPGIEEQTLASLEG
jgi:glyoxylase-like metal-dependent hydrolase (beta-lactamase superfamily II)